MSPIDAIGDRLDHPENVPEELKHLIADDVARVEKILSIPVSGRVLDVGCSDGAITRRIRERWGVDAIGCDVRATEYRPSFVWDIRKAIGRAPFSAIYACEVFEHLTDADAQFALTNILAALKPGGDLIVTVPNRYPDDLYEVGCRSRWAWPDHRSAWHPQKLTAWLSPHFASLEYLPLRAEDRLVYTYGGTTYCEDRSIWLIVHASGKK